MKIIIAGCGKIGVAITKSMLKEGHDVTVIDSDRDRVNEMSNIFEVMGVSGNAADSGVLAEADVPGTDLFIAVTASDEMNMLACFVAKKMGAAHTIARIRNPEYNDNNLPFLRQNLMLDLSINPELLAARELYNLLKIPSAVKLETFSRRRLEMAELRLKSDSPLCGLSLQELKKKYPAAARALEERAYVYNHQLDVATRLSREGKVLILAPYSIDGMQTLTRDKEKIEWMYRLGLEDAERIRSFL